MQPSVASRLRTATGIQAEPMDVRTRRGSRATVGYDTHQILKKEL
jgi:hypothetical protein